MNRISLLSFSLFLTTSLLFGYRTSAQSVPDKFVLSRLPDEKTLQKDLQVLLTADKWGAQISPDGRKLAITRSFSGTNEVWVCDIDGSNLLKLTSLNGPEAGTSRWSPDGKWIAFDVNWTNHGKIFMVSIQGGPAREIAPGASNHLVPNWSRDGKWIYFASDSSGEWQVWKAPVWSGHPVQITHQGGFAATESADRTFVYYSKHRYPNPEVWRVPIGGNSEEMVSPLVHPMTWADWSVSSEGIYFVTEDEDKPLLEYFDFASTSVGRVAELANPSFSLSLSSDGHLVVCAGKNWRNTSSPDVGPG